ncbi:MAG: IS1 family transposase [Gemmatimonadales bacterium]
MNKTPTDTRALILNCLTDGMSIRATSRLTGSAKGTILRLLAEVGEFCEVYQYHRLRKLTTTRIEADEQWSFLGAKQKNAKEGQGDIWTFCALDADTKLVMSWLVGARSPENTYAFIADLAGRVVNRVQLTTDGFAAYTEAVRRAFGFARCDFAQLVKSYGPGQDTGAPQTSRRYSPMVCTGAVKVRRIGKPVEELVSTSFVERLNLNTRQNCRRFTRLTNGFSRKAENHGYAVALHFFAYNFCRAHGTLTKAAQGAKTTPAMAAGLTERPWTMADLLALMEPTFLLR